MHGSPSPVRPTPRSTRLPFVAVLAALAAFVAASPSLDAIERASPTAVLARASAAAVRGRVAALASTQDPATGAIYTLVTIDVARAWGFPAAPTRVEVRVLGGVHGTTALIVGEQAHFTRGEDVFVLLEVRPRDGSFAVTGLERGKWSLAPGYDDAGLDALAALTGTHVRLSADWTPVQGLPDPAGLDAATDLDVVGAGRWHEADWSASVPVDSAPGGHVLFPGGGFAQMLRAIETWSAAGALRLAPGRWRTPRCFVNGEAADGRISIAYDDPCGEIPNTSPTLAIGGAYLDLQDRRVVQGVSYGRFTKGMIVLDDAATKYAGLSTGCYEEILTHELGHAIGLAHTDVQPSIMAPWLTPACVERQQSQPLQPVDIAALLARYPAAPIDGPPATPGAVWTAVQGSTVSLTWSAAAGAPATAYHVVAGSLPGGSDVGTAVVTTPSFVATGVSRGVYYVRIIATNGAGASAPTADVAITVGDGLPGAPVGLMAAAGPAGSVRVMWQPPRSGAPADAYALLVGTTPGHPDSRVPMSGTTLSATGVARGTYYVRAVGVNGNGTGPASPEITVVVP